MRSSIIIRTQAIVIDTDMFALRPLNGFMSTFECMNASQLFGMASEQSDWYAMSGDGIWPAEVNTVSVATVLSFPA